MECNAMECNAMQWINGMNDYVDPMGTHTLIHGFQVNTQSGDHQIKLIDITITITITTIMIPKDEITITLECLIQNRAAKSGRVLDYHAILHGVKCIMELEVLRKHHH